MELAFGLLINFLIGLLVLGLLYYVINLVAGMLGAPAQILTVIRVVFVVLFVLLLIFLLKNLAGGVHTRLLY